MNGLSIPRRTLIDVGAVLTLLAVPIAGFWTTYGGPGYLVPAVGGLVLGLIVAGVGAGRRWGILTVTGATIVVYFVFGTALAVPQEGLLAVIPTGRSLLALLTGVVTSWKQLLTTVPPVGAFDGNGLVPFLLMLIAATVTLSIALRVRHAGWALIPATAALVVQIAMGAARPAIPVIEGIVFALVCVLWLALRQAAGTVHAAVSVGGGDDAPSRSGLHRRMMVGGGILVVAVVAGVATSGFTAPAAPRQVLRDVVIPPFHVQDYPSPLQSWRHLVRDDKDTALFTVSDLPVGSRVRLAVMDSYSGAVYNVSDTGYGSSSAFRPVRANMSADAEGTSTTVDVTIGALEGVWMPDVGAVRSIDFRGDDAEKLRVSTRYNESTSTGIALDALREGDRYRLHTVIRSRPSDKTLAKTPLAPVKIPKQDGVPQDFASIASDMTEDASTPIEQVRALQKALSDGGYFSHGLEGEPRSLPGHGAARLSTLLNADEMVGDDEQYASAMALLAGTLGIPARVVMGFHPDEEAFSGGEFTATGDDLHAWVEVPFQGVGWVAFDPTPPKDHIPSEQTSKPKAKPKPQVLQPPPPAQQAADEPPTIPTERDKKDKDPESSSGIWAILAATGIGAGVLMVVASPFILIGGLKTRRRRKRRTAPRNADRISGGWDELVDRALDFGTVIPGGATRVEDAAVVGDAFDHPTIATLALRADAQVFGPDDPSDEQVDEYWSAVDETTTQMRSQRGLWARIVSGFSLRSLLAGTRLERWLPAPRRARKAAKADVSAHGVGVEASIDLDEERVDQAAQPVAGGPATGDEEVRS